MGIIEEEKITWDLGGQGETLRRLCTWLELWVDLGREQFMLTLTKKCGHRWTCSGSDEEIDGAKGEGQWGGSQNGNLRSDYGGRLRLFSGYKFFLEQNLET